MNDTRNITIAVLCVSATMLATVLGLLILSGPARADTPVAGGDYIMFTGASSGANDMLYVIDQRAGKLNAYRYERNDNRIKREEHVDLKKLFRGK